MRRAAYQARIDAESQFFESEFLELEKKLTDHLTNLWSLAAEDFAFCRQSGGAGFIGGELYEFVQKQVGRLHALTLPSDLSGAAGVITRLEAEAHRHYQQAQRPVTNAKSAADPGFFSRIYARRVG